jgi:hypothetical protein
VSTRTRIVMTYKGRFHNQGAKAIKELLSRLYPNAMTLEGRLNQLKAASKKEKLIKLAKKLPPEFALTFIQEPRGTRKNRSLYWKLRAAQEVPPDFVGGIG